MTEGNATMSFLEHLSELRVCIAKALAGIGIMSLICFFFSSHIFQLLTAPLKAVIGEGNLVGLSPAEGFIVKLKVAIAAGFVLASPFTFSQVWSFISPGLKESEQRLTIPFITLTTLCFTVGILFCYFLIFPFAFKFFMGEFESIGVQPTIRIGEYLTFSVKLMMVFGLVFELPVITWFLARLNLLTADWLKTNARYAIVFIFILAAMLTPPDVATQLLLAGPLILLYGICIPIAKAANPQKK